ncbi:SPW repeat domain-containing protein, partial [Paraglaciecola mesophila]|uniref:SPW repeat domain-containing protein n=1 Tax=Paraglaciecola mesophila TaxID=197222 RepID=UPI000586A0B7
LRFINLLFGLWLIASPLIVDGGQIGGMISTALVGVFLILLSLPRGKRSHEHYGQWDKWII